MGANISSPGQGTGGIDAPPSEDAIAMGVFMNEGLDDLKSYPIGLNSSIASSYAQSELHHDGLAALSYTSLATLSMRATITANSIPEEGGPQRLFVATSRQLSPHRNPGLASYSPSSVARRAQEQSQDLDSPVSCSLPELTFRTSPRSGAPPIFMLTHQLDSASVTPVDTPRTLAEGSCNFSEFFPSPRRCTADKTFGGETLDMSVVRSSISLTIPREVVRSSISLTITRPTIAVASPSVDLAVAQLSQLISSPRPSSSVSVPAPPAEQSGQEAAASRVTAATEDEALVDSGSMCQHHDTGKSDADEVSLLAQELALQPPFPLQVQDAEAQEVRCQRVQDTYYEEQHGHAGQQEGSGCVMQTSSNGINALILEEPALIEQTAFEFNPSPRAAPVTSVTAHSNHVPQQFLVGHVLSASESKAAPCTAALTAPHANTSSPDDAILPEAATPSVGREGSQSIEDALLASLPHMLLTSQKPDESAFELVGSFPSACNAPEYAPEDAAVDPRLVQSCNPISATPAIGGRPYAAQQVQGGVVGEPLPAVQQQQEQQVGEEKMPGTDDVLLIHSMTSATGSALGAALVGELEPLSLEVGTSSSASTSQAAECLLQVGPASCSKIDVGVAASHDARASPAPVCRIDTAEEPHHASELLTLDRTAAAQCSTDSGPTTMSLGQARCDPPAHPLQTSEHEWTSESEHEGWAEDSELVRAETEPVGPNSEPESHTRGAVVTHVHNKAVAHHSEDVVVTRSEDQAPFQCAEEPVDVEAQERTALQAEKVIADVASPPTQETRSGNRRTNRFLCCFLG